MNNEIVKINHEEYGITEVKATEIKKLFVPMLDKMEMLEESFNRVMSLEISEESCKEAKELLKEYVKVRTGTAGIHKELKGFYLKGGRFVDGFKNAQIMASEGVEKKLKERANHFDILKKEAQEKLNTERLEKLNKYGYDDNEIVHGMSDKLFNALLMATKSEFEEAERLKKEAEEAEEKARLEREAEEKRIRDENAKLKAEADEAKRVSIEKENILKKERQKEADELKKVENEKAKIKAESEKVEAEKKESDRLLKEANEKAERMEREKKETEDRHKAELKELSDKSVEIDMDKISISKKEGTAIYVKVIRIEKESDNAGIFILKS